MEERKFWLVWNLQGRNPSVVHPSKELAEKEAGRLARLHPEYVFYVVEVLSKHFVEERPVIRVELE